MEDIITGQSLDLYLQNNLDLLCCKELYYGPTMEALKTNYIISNVTETQMPDEMPAMPVLFVNELRLHLIFKICQEMRAVAIPLYVYYDEDVFGALIRKYDIKQLVETYSIAIIVGKEALEYFFSRPIVIYPSTIYGDTDGSVQKLVTQMQAEWKRKLSEIERELECFYEENAQSIAFRIKTCTATICILKNTFESGRFKLFFRQFQAVAECMGYRVIICDEPSIIFRTPEIINLYQYKPDMVFQIDKTRNGDTFTGEPLRIRNMEGLVYVNWILDIHPSILSKSYAESLKKRDFVFSLFDKKVLEKYNYKDENVIYGGIMSVDKQVFARREITKPEHEKYDCDICFAGTVMGAAGCARFIITYLVPYLSGEQLDRVLEKLFELLERIYDMKTGRYMASPGVQRTKIINELQAELGFDEETKGQIDRVFSVMGYDRLRMLVLKQLAATGRYRIHFYGEVNPEIEGVLYQGIAVGEELSKAMQCAKITIQINPDATMNQRVIESILSHTMVMVYKMNPDSDMCNILQYLKEGEGISFFTNSDELFGKCDYFLENDEVRDKIAECGYKKAREGLDIETIFGHLLEELGQRLAPEIVEQNGGTVNG